MVMFMAATATVATAASLSSTAHAQAYPSKAVHINTGGTGSVGDLVSRLLAPKLTEKLGQQVLVENRPSGPVLGGLVAKAAPDGHTLLVTGNSFWLLPNFQKDVSWDPVKDFAPVSLLTSSPQRAGSASLGTGQVGQGTHRLCEEPAGQGALGVGPARHGQSPGG